ncbi:hypothetical protein EC968_003176 [Mortierella alpina]|nr:hypothetical protein EC968_003176 [Mortierella alpina]
MSRLNPCRGRSKWRPLLAQVSLLLTAALFLGSAEAQALDATAVQEMAFVRAGKYLYVQGGKVVRDEADLAVLGQLFALDLSVSWPVKSPPWEALAGGRGVNLHSAVATPDNQTLITFAVERDQFTLTIARYDVQQKQWLSSISELPTGDVVGGMKAVMDPQTEAVYINGAGYLQVYNSRSDALRSEQYSPGAFPSRAFAGGVYNSARKTIMYLGGYSPNFLYENTTYISEYATALQTWSILKTHGERPSPRADHCMAASEDGNTVVVFGGRVPPRDYDFSPLTNHIDTAKNFTGSLHVLDVRSGEWTQQQSSSPRLYAACIIVGDQFLAWGGFDGMNTVNNTPIVFDLTKREWVTSYRAPLYYSQGQTATQPPQEEFATTRPSNTPAILGGTLGAMALIALTVLAYLFIKRKSNLNAWAQQSSINNSGSTLQSKKSSITASQFHQSDGSQVRSPYALYEKTTSGRNPQEAMAMSGSFWEPHRSKNDPQLPYSEGCVTPPLVTYSSFGASTTLAPASSYSPLTVSTSWSYTPPTLIPVEANPSPVIFVPQGRNYYSHSSSSHIPSAPAHDNRDSAGRPAPFGYNYHDGFLPPHSTFHSELRSAPMPPITYSQPPILNYGRASPDHPVNV